MNAKLWDRRYSKGVAYGDEANIFLKDVAAKYFRNGQSVLLVGEGEGRNALHLAKKS